MAEKKKKRPAPKKTSRGRKQRPKKAKVRKQVEVPKEATPPPVVEKPEEAGPPRSTDLRRAQVESAHERLPTVEVLKPAFKEEIFGAKVNPYLLHQMVTMQLNSRRAGTASTKTKGLVRGGGKKPWRQKGTGNARAGSIRSPLWVGGGTVFGPHPRDYSYRLPKKARRGALISALSLKNRDGKIIVIDKLELAEAKTRLMRKMLEGLRVKNALVVIPQFDEKVERSARNLPNVKVLRAEGLNVHDLLRYEHLILTQGALRVIEERLAPNLKEAEVKAPGAATM